MDELSTFVELLRERKLKATPKRLALLGVVADYGSAIPYSQIQKLLSNFDRVTLYRTLNALMDNGIIHKASSSGQETYYAICSPHCTSHQHQHNHVHFKCTNCLEVSCIHIEQPIGIKIPNVVVHNVEIEATGLCVRCQ